MAAALCINASSEPRGCPLERKRKSTKSHDRSQDKRNPSVMSDKYIHVHHYLNTGRWGTWFNDPTLKRGSGKRRLYFGTYATEYLAARAQDRAALKFKPWAVRPIASLNFAESDYDLDKDLRDKLTHGQFRKLLMTESRKCYKTAEPSPCVNRGFQLLLVAFGGIHWNQPICGDHVFSYLCYELAKGPSDKSRSWDVDRDPGWRIFLEEEEAKGNIHISHGNRNHRKNRTFPEVLQEIVNKNEAVDIVEATEPIEEPVGTLEEDGKVRTAKRIKRPTRAAPNQPADEVPRYPVPEERVGSVSLRTRSLNARPVLKATPVAAKPVLRLHTRSDRLSAGPVRNATPQAPQPVPPRDTRNRSLNARQIVRTTPNAAPPVVLRRDRKNPRHSARPVPKRAPEASPPVLRREPSRRRVWPKGGEVRGAVQSSRRSSVHLDRIEWGRTRRRSSMRNLNELSLPKAACSDDTPVAANSLNVMPVAANVLCEVPSATSAGEKGPLGTDTKLENPTMRRRLIIDLNLLPEPSCTASAASTVARPDDSDATGGNNEPEVSSAECLLLLKSGGKDYKET